MRRVAVTAIAALAWLCAIAPVALAHPHRMRLHRRPCAPLVHRRCRAVSTHLTRQAASPLQLSVLGPYSVQLSWPVLSAAASVQISLGGAVVDRFPATAQNTYVLRELWPQTAYTASVQLITGAGATVGSFSASFTTATAPAPFPRLYGSGSFINAPIPASPALDANSPAIVSSALAAYAGSANLSNTNAWGIPILPADTQSTSYGVGCLYYWCTSQFAPVHIPSVAKASSGSDGHLAVLEPDGTEMDMWVGQRSGAGWTAGERWLANASGAAVNCARAWGCGAADAAGFALGAGVVRPEEIAQGHIDHALLITTPYTRQGYIACPAISGDGHHATTSALPIGAHVQLDPTVNVAALSLPAWQKVIAVALQRYGAYVGDTGGSLEVRAESNLGRSYDAWAKAGVPSSGPSLAGLPWSRMRVLSMTQCATN